MHTSNARGTAAIKTVVFADDDRLFREAITEVLTTHGYTVHLAQDGLEALEMICEVRPDCLLLDVVLPKLDGGEVCAMLRRDPRLREIPIIVLSSLSLQDFTLFPNLSADAYVAKTALPTACQNILTAIQHVTTRDLGHADRLLLGYEDFSPHSIVTELLLQRRHLRALFEVLVPTGLELDPEGRIILANGGACTLLGKQAKELLGKPLAALVPPADQQRVQDLLTEFGRAAAPTDCRTTFQVGSKFLAVHFAVIRDGATCLGLVVILEPDAVQWPGTRRS